jgi:hypothetical protein
MDGFLCSRLLAETMGNELMIWLWRARKASLQIVYSRAFSDRNLTTGQLQVGRL